MKGEKSLLVCLGALWGLVEATLGWGLHFMHVAGKGKILFLIGLVIMIYGIRRTGKPYAAITIAGVAALIKLSNLVFPAHYLFRSVFNPFMYILMEGAIVTVASAVLFKLFDKQKSLFVPTVQPAIKVNWVWSASLVVLAVVANMIRL